MFPACLISLFKYMLIRIDRFQTKAVEPKAVKDICFLPPERKGMLYYNQLHNTNQRQSFLKYPNAIQNYNTVF